MSERKRKTGADAEEAFGSGVSGTVRRGETPIAAKGTIADADGVWAESTSTYQWIRVDGGNEAFIPGTNSRTHTLATADEGRKIKGRVLFTDNMGGEELRSSDA